MFRAPVMLDSVDPTCTAAQLQATLPSAWMGTRLYVRVGPSVGAALVVLVPSNIILEAGASGAGRTGCSAVLNAVSRVREILPGTIQIKARRAVTTSTLDVTICELNAG